MKKCYYSHNGRQIWYPIVPAYGMLNPNGKHRCFCQLMEMIRNLDIAQWVPLAIADLSQHMAWLPREMDYEERRRVKHTRYWDV